MKSVFLVLLVAFATSCSSDTKSQEPTQVVINNEDKTKEIQGSIELETVVVTKLDASGNVVSTFTDSIYFIKLPFTDYGGDEIWLTTAISHGDHSMSAASGKQTSINCFIKELKEIKTAILDGYSEYKTSNDNMSFRDNHVYSSGDYSSLGSTWNEAQEHDIVQDFSFSYKDNEQALKTIDFILNNIKSAELTASYSIEKTPQGKKIKKTH